jgi:hypothetical protein
MHACMHACMHARTHAHLCLHNNSTLHVIIVPTGNNTTPRLLLWLVVPLCSLVKPWHFSIEALARARQLAARFDPSEGRFVRMDVCTYVCMCACMHVCI